MPYRLRARFCQGVHFHQCIRFLIASIVVGAITIGYSSAAIAQAVGGQALKADADYQGLRGTVYQISAYGRTITRLRSDLQNGKTSNALLLIQQLLEQPEDCFVLSEENRKAYTLWLEVNRLLAKQPRSVITEYEKTAGRAAAVFLNEAIEKDDLALLTAVVRRFLHTKAGFKAVQLSVRRMLDLGDSAAALRLLARVENTTAHGSRVATKEFQFLKATALMSSGRTEEARKLLAESRWLQETVDRVEDAVILPRVSNTDWLNTFGNVSRNHETEATTPWLRSKWSVRFLDDHSETSSIPIVRDIEATWQNMTTVRTPVVANGVIAIRHLDSISGYDLLTGDRKWSFNCNYSIFDAIKDPRVSGSLPVKREILCNSVIGTLSTDGMNVYAIDTVKQSNMFDAYTMSHMGRQATINRLIALPLDPDDETTQKPLWVAGGSYSLPDWFSVKDTNHDRLVTERELGDAARFAKLDINKDKTITADEAIDNNDAEAPLADHFFIGPPLAVHGRLFCVTESAGDLSAVALNPETGAVIWKQRIAYTQRAISIDSPRQRLSCTPTYANGILICPTNNSVLVALDAFDGSLVWGAFDGNSDRYQPNRRGIRFSSRQKPLGNTAFTTAPVVEGDRIFYRPRYSNSVQCFDLNTGERKWSSPSQPGREDIDQCVATATDEIVVTLGSSFIRGLNPEDGTEVWFTPLQSIAGRGIRSGDNYLLPVDTGRVLTIDIATGQTVGYSRSHDNFVQSAPTRQTDGLPRGWTPGNLAAVGPWIVSTRPDRIDLLPQVGSLLKTTQLRIGNLPPQPADQLMMAELNLAMGQLIPARNNLYSLLDRSAAADVHPYAESLMRELLYLDLSRPANREKQILAELSTYSKTTSDRARYLVHQSRFDVKTGNHKQLMATTQELQQLMTDRPLNISADDYHQVSALAWTNGMTDQIIESADDTTLKRLSNDYQTAFHELASPSTPPQQLLAFARSSGSPVMNSARVLAANRLSDGAEFQRAEILLLRNAESPDTTVAVEATVTLAKLWNRLGLSGAALLLVNELQYKHSLTDELRSRLVTARKELSSTASGRRAAEQMAPIRHRVFNANITAAVEDKYQILGEPLDSAQSLFPLLSNAFHVFRSPGRQTTDLFFVDRVSGAVVGRFKCPASHSAPEERVNRGLRNINCGHYFPVGLYGTVKAVSLLKSDVSIPFWESRFDDLGIKTVNKSAPLAIGPAGPGFCSFQTHDTLTVLDPFDGSLLWSRSDIPGKGGLIRNPEMGLFGDDKAIVLLAADNSTYTVYRTSTGEQIRETSLQTASLQQRRVMGRKLMFVSGTGKETRFKVWDPLTDEFEFDFAAYQPKPRKLLSNKLPTGELVAVVDAARLVIYDSKRKRFVSQLHLPDINWEAVNHLVGYCEGDTYYIGLSRANKFNVGSTWIPFDKKNPISTPIFSDDLLAIDRLTGKLKWHRTISKRSFVKTPHFNLPFLISLTFLTDRKTRQTETLSVELIDKRTGDTLTNVPPIPLDPEFVRVSYDHRRHRVEIKSGHESRGYRGPSGVEINFGPRLQIGDSPGTLRRPIP